MYLFLQIGWHKLCVIIIVRYLELSTKSPNNGIQQLQQSVRWLGTARNGPSYTTYTGRVSLGIRSPT